MSLSERLRSIVSLAGALAAALALAVAWPSAARAQGDFLTDLLLNEQQERSLAEQEHPKVLAQFGGVYEDRALQAYVQSLTDFLGKASNRPDIRYRITILNSPIVNAFALPAGYLYVTRGLLALAGNEAELAGVLAHEIGHVTARHTAQRYSRTVLAQGIVGLLGTMTRGTNMAGVGNLVAPVAVLGLQSFSREHEHEADLLGVVTMSRAGFDPYAIASFLDKLNAKTALDQRLAGQQAGGGFNLLATHPRTADRVARTIAQARGTSVRQPMTARDIYLRKVDGMLYGDDPKQGFVRGRLFAHPELDLRFEVPEGFTLLNGQEEVIARGPNGASIKFDAAKAGGAASPVSYLRDVWAKDLPVEALERVSINGFPGATGLLRYDDNGQSKDLRLVAIEDRGRALYRFLFVAPSQVSAQFEDDFIRTARSFGRLSRAERRDLKPRRLVLHRVRQGETVASLSRWLPHEREREARFRVLNGLQPGADVRPGDTVKLVVE